MKKILKFLSLFIVVAFMASCASDDVALDNAQNDGNVISFTFSGLNYGGITYAIATAPENQADNLDVYMFEYEAGGNGQFHHKWNSDDPDFSVTQTGLTQTISLGNGNSYGEGNKKFYFVANPDPTTALEATGKSEKQFVESLTKALGAASGKGDLLATPLLFTGVSDAMDPLNPVNTTVTMKRRVARFDIVNEYENFVVEKVLVSNAKLQGYVFGTAQGTGSPVMPKASLKEITTIPAYVPENNERISRSVFYLYPTTISDTETEIAIQASLNGEPSDLYYLDPAASAMSIDANHRYKLVIHKDIAYGTYSIDLVYVDWDEGKEIYVKETEALEIADVKFAPDHDKQIVYWDDATKTLNMTKSKATEMTFTVKNPLNLTWEAKVIAGDAAHVKTMPVLTSTQTLTYGAEVSHACKVTLPEFDGTKLNKAVTIRLRIQNSSRLEEYTDIFFKREPTIRLNLNRIQIVNKVAKIVPFEEADLPYDLHIYYFPSEGTLYDGTLKYDKLTAEQVMKGTYDTGRDNISQGWTIVCWGTDPNALWGSYLDPTKPFYIINFEYNLRPHKTRKKFSVPLQTQSISMWWQSIKIEQGESIEEPLTVSHTPKNALISVTVKGIDKIKEPDTQQQIDNNQLWLSIHGQARACNFEGKNNFDRGFAHAPLITTVAVDTPPTINGTTATWGPFGTFGTITPISKPEHKYEVRLMYKDKMLANKILDSTPLNPGGISEIIFESNDNSKISVTIIINGWVVIEGNTGI